MTNIEKVKCILDAGHWVKATDKHWKSYKIYDQPKDWWVISYKIDDGELEMFQINEWEDCTIEVIQRIPTEYSVGDKVILLSSPFTGIKNKDTFVWKICEVRSIWYSDVMITYQWEDRSVPYHCIAPAVDDIDDDEEDEEENESTVTSNLKRYSVAMLYQKHAPGYIENKIRNIIVTCTSDKEAIWEALEFYRKEMEGFQLSLYTIIKID